MSKLRLRDRLQLLRASVTGQWEGYELDRRRNRPNARLVSQDTDLDLGTREKIMAEARSLGQVWGIVNRILRLYANYCVGSCKAQFQTEDEDWNQLAEVAWQSAMKRLDFTRCHSFQKMAKLAVISELRDGDVFFQKVKVGNFPMLQAIEGDRITNGNLYNFDEEGITGGVLHTKEGVPYAYRRWDRNRYGAFENKRDISRDSMMHLYDPMRFDSFRGVSIFASGALNHGRDAKEIVQAEKGAVKVNSKIALFWKKVAGGISNAGGVHLFGDVDGESDGQITTQEINDVMVAYGYPTESLEAHHSDRPSTVFEGFLEFLVHEISIGVDLPKSFVWSMAGLTGPGARMESKQAERTFAAKQETVEAKLLFPTLGWVIPWEMQSGRLPFHPEWYKATFQRPAHPSIDVGRESQADIAELENGITTEEAVNAASGRDGAETRIANQRETRHRLILAKELADEFKIPLMEAYKMMGGRNSNSIAKAPEPKEPDKEEEDEEESPELRKSRPVTEEDEEDDE